MAALVHIAVASWSWQAIRDGPAVSAVESRFNIHTALAIIDAIAFIQVASVDSGEGIRECGSVGESQEKDENGKGLQKH